MGKMNSIGKKIRGTTSKASRSIKEDFKEGGIKKVARNKYAWILCAILLLILGAISDEESMDVTPGKTAEANASTSETASSEATDLSDDFLNSKVVIGQHWNYAGDFTVRELVDRIQLFDLGEGKHPVLKGWKSSGSKHSLKTEWPKGTMKFVFKHIPSDRGNHSDLSLKTWTGTASDDEAMGAVIQINQFAK